MREGGGGRGEGAMVEREGWRGGGGRKSGKVGEGEGGGKRLNLSILSPSVKGAGVKS